MRALLAAIGLLSLLTGFGWPGASERLVGELTLARTPRDKRDALRMLAALREPFAIEAVLPLARDPDPGVRADAIRLLGTGELGLEDPSPEVRSAAWLALSERGDARALQGLDDVDPQVRLAVLHAVAPAAGRLLVAKLDDDALEVRVAAAHALAGEVDALLARVDAPLPELRAAVIDALGRGERTPEVERALMRARRDRDPGVAQAAERGLRKRDRATPPDDPAWLPALERTVARDVDEATLLELERTIDDRAGLATAALAEWLPRASLAWAPRIVALIERSGGPLDASTMWPWIDAGGERRALALRVIIFAQLSDALLRRLAMLYLETHDRNVLRALRPLEDARLRRALERDVRDGDAETAALALHAGAPALAALDDPRPGVVIAALRASVHDHSPAACAKRAALRGTQLGQVAASALTASLLAGDPLDAHGLIASLSGDRAWPLGPVASFAIARLGAPVPTDAAADAITRHNRAHPVAPMPAKASFLAAKRFDQPRALRSEDGLLLISWPDASGRIDWPTLRIIDVVSAWPREGERN